MYTNTIFIGYMVAIFLSLLCLALVMLVLVRKEFRKDPLFICIRNFSIALFLTGVLFFMFYYREAVQNKFELGLPFRIADYTLSCTLFFTWLLFAGQLMERDKRERARKGAIILTAVRLLISLIVTACFMGPYYNIDQQLPRLIWHGFQGIFTAATVFFLIQYAAGSCRHCASPLRRRYVIVSTILLVMFELEQSFIEIGLARGTYGISAWELKVPDPTGALIFALSLAAFVFIFKEDFGPLFFADKPLEHFVESHEQESFCLTAGTEEDQKAVLPPSASPVSAEETAEKRIALLTETYGLTVREKEVARLVYEGYTNPQISEELYISVNTVKKHLQNTYEKLGVNSRIELIKLADEIK